jgi:hypothetical protein
MATPAHEELPRASPQAAVVMLDGLKPDAATLRAFRSLHPDLGKLSPIELRKAFEAGRYVVRGLGAQELLDLAEGVTALGARLSAEGIADAY